MLYLKGGQTEFLCFTTMLEFGEKVFLFIGPIIKFSSGLALALIECTPFLHSPMSSGQQP